MDIRTYRARSMQDALALVRQELGPNASVLHTREVRAGGWIRRLRRVREIEVTASAAVKVPSRLPVRMQAPAPVETWPAAPAHLEQNYRAKFRDDLKQQLNDLQSMVEDLC